MVNPTESSRRREEQDANILDQLIVDALLENRNFKDTALSPYLRHEISNGEKARILATLPNQERLRNRRAYAGLPVERIVRLAWIADAAVIKSAGPGAVERLNARGSYGAMPLAAGADEVLEKAKARARFSQ